MVSGQSGTCPRCGTPRPPLLVGASLIERPNDSPCGDCEARVMLSPGPLTRLAGVVTASRFVPEDRRWRRSR